MIRYLTTDEILIINAEVSGGETQLRDKGLLESAAARPMATFSGMDAYPTVTEKAAALLHSLCRNHAFVDGNKRTATIAMILFLQYNGYQVKWEPAEALEFIIDVATGEHDVPEITAWLNKYTDQT